MTAGRRSLLLAAVSGVALGLSGPPLAATALAFASSALLLAALGTGPQVPRARSAFVLGAVAGTAVNAVALWWVVPLLQTFARFPFVAAVPTAALLWVVQGLPFAFAAAAAASLGRRGAPMWLILPAALTVAFTVTPSLFPWRPAASQVPWLAWIQPAELGGVPLLDLLLLLGGCALARAAWPSVPGASRALALAVALACIAGPAAYGTVRLPEVASARERAPVLRVGVVQPDIGIFAKHDPLEWSQHLAILHRMTRVLEQRGAELVVWPETAYPYPFFRDRWADLPGRRAVLGDRVRGPVLFGAITQRSLCERWNSTLAMNRDGRVVGRADKVHLLAFGETVPGWHWLPPLRIFFRCPGLTPGQRPVLVHVAGARVGVLNCYEDILAHYTRRLATLGPELLVNVTNDAWFGDTSEPWLHDQVAVLRSVETRRDLVRAVNTGVSAHVLATGAQAVRTPTWVQTSFIADVRLLKGQTPWVRFGDLVSPALAGALLGLALALRRRPVHVP